MSERTRSTSVALRPTEQEALERLAKAAGLSRSGLVRRWIAMASRSEEPGRTTRVLGREGEQPGRMEQGGRSRFAGADPGNTPGMR